ncbi:putative uncharacterized protein DDB_G0291608 [Scylla paramamosain]|uniref:putative uncharacterized protein DDB_G0291608 n=1 Tax=Scylla paramamosain TaxID=85552 RepID=UPI003082F01D
MASCIIPLRHYCAALKVTPQQRLSIKEKECSSQKSPGEQQQQQQQQQQQRQQQRVSHHTCTPQSSHPPSLNANKHETDEKEKKRKKKQQLILTFPITTSPSLLPHHSCPSLVPLTHAPHQHAIRGEQYKKSALPPASLQIPPTPRRASPPSSEGTFNTSQGATRRWGRYESRDNGCQSTRRAMNSLRPVLREAIRHKRGLETSKNLDSMACGGRWAGGRGGAGLLEVGTPHYDPSRANQITLHDTQVKMEY